MTSSIVDPHRSQAVRLSATRSLLALDGLRHGGALGFGDLEALKGFSADLDEIARWEGWIREEALLTGVLSGTSAAADRFRESVAFEAIEFTPDDVQELRDTATELSALVDNPSRCDAGAIDAVEDICTKLIRKLAPQANLDVALTSADLPRN